MDADVIVESADARLTCQRLDFHRWRNEIGTIRRQTFVEVLGWVEANEENLELDRHDLEAMHIGVVSRKDPGRLIAYARLLDYGNMMVQHPPFDDLLKGDLADQSALGKDILEKAVEVSRNCGDINACSQSGGTYFVGLAQLLLYLGVVKYLGESDCSGLLAVVVDNRKTESDTRETSKPDEGLRLARSVATYSFYHKLVKSFRVVGKPKVCERGPVVCIYTPYAECAAFMARFHNLAAGKIQGGCT